MKSYVQSFWHGISLPDVVQSQVEEYHPLQTEPRPSVKAYPVPERLDVALQRSASASSTYTSTSTSSASAPTSVLVCRVSVRRVISVRVVFSRNELYAHLLHDLHYHIDIVTTLSARAYLLSPQKDIVRIGISIVGRVRHGIEGHILRYGRRRGRRG